MRALVVDANSRAEIKRVRDYAEKNRWNLNDMKFLMAGELKPAGDNPNYRCYVPMGFRVVFSLEEHIDGWYRHISVSVDNVEKCPSVPAVLMLMKEFGFPQKSFDECAAVWLDDDIKPTAVNVLAPEKKNAGVYN